MDSGNIEERLRFSREIRGGKEHLLEDDGKELAIKALAVHRILKEEHGDRKWHPRLEPVGELISTILSQNTNDVNRDRTYSQLRERFPAGRIAC